MSHWTYIDGTITVSPMGRTTHEKRYILETVLDHLPLVTGSEEDMEVHIVELKTYDSSVSCDEFAQDSNQINRYGDGWQRINDKFILVVHGNFRDREYEQTFKEFNKWINRLAKRCMVMNVLVKISCFNHSIIIDNPKPYFDMFEIPSWNSEGEVNWCEYLLWQCAKDDNYPAVLLYKYYNDPENDKRVRNWLGLEGAENND